MFAWLSAHLVDIVLVLIIVAVVALIIRKSVKDKKAGKHSCGGNCANCSMACSCHSDNQQTHFSS